MPSSGRLRHESSPYLQQHADNPVDWYPWGPEALEAARREDKPILLSIGYSACHWCHVMAHECFENPAIAEQMNRSFINIKVDREERPDLDHVYQLVCWMLTQSGGWPLTVFLTPAGEPFFAGTYFPPDDRYGRPGFPKVLEALAAAYRDQREQVAEQARQLVAALERVQTADEPGEPSSELLEGAWRVLRQQVDRRHGGFGQAPKFPNPFGLELLLRQHARTGDAEPLELALHALRAMRDGGIFDQLAGGFHRYSTDAGWLVPHFEKMLYDNALLPPLYLDGYAASGAVRLADGARATLDWLLADMRSPEGGFYSTTDADSEGAEGRYFVWTPEQIRAVLDPPTAALVCERFGITPGGNFEQGASVLSVVRGLRELADSRGTDETTIAATLETARRMLLAERAQRVPPFRDEKIICAWNGLAIIALARAGARLSEPRYLDAARAAAAFCVDRLLIGGRLRRVFMDGTAHVDAFLDDHAALAVGLLELFCATAEPHWLAGAENLVRVILDEFADGGVLHMTRRDAEALVVRPVEKHDNATPSGATLTARALLRLWQLTGDDAWHDALWTILRSHAATMRENPWGTAGLLTVLDSALAPPRSIVVAGDGPAAAALWAAAHQGYDPHRLVCRAAADPEAIDAPALLRGRGPLNGRPAAYACEGLTCRLPVTDPADLLHIGT